MLQQLVFAFALAFSFLTAPAIVWAVEGAPRISPDMKLVDQKAPPCEDFYRYACGQWMDQTKIPADRPGWDRGFTAIEERNQKVLRSILGKYAKGGKSPKNPYATKLGKFYGACMKDDKDKTARPWLKTRIGKIEKITKESLPVELAWLHQRGVSALFSFSSEQDLKNPQMMIAEVNQGGLGLPSRDYYMDTSEKMQEVRERYVKHLTKVLLLTGEKKREAQRDADAILNFETNLAQGALRPVDMRDPNKLYNKTKSLAIMVPSFKWASYFQALGIATPVDYNITAPTYMKRIEYVLSSAPIEVLRAYLRVRLAEASARALPGPFLNEFFDFYYHYLYGLNELPAKWKRCVNASDEFMGFALGRSFVAETFKGESKDKVKEMVKALETQMSTLILDAKWMDAATKKRAFHKLETLVNQVGYPDEWRSYDGLTVGSSYLQNRLEAIAFENAYEWAKIGKPVDRKEWGMTPAMVNAAYEPQLNRIIFPAGILQSPFFDKGFSTSANYAAMGMIMAHEISHGFDDSGSEFDETGTVANWWTPASKKQFKARAQCLAAQFDQFPTAGLGHVNGLLTLGEDIGDQAGLKLAYKAWKAKSSEKGDSVDATKNFFLSFAQAWCGKDTDNFEQVRVNTDPHPPSRFRVNGALMNFSEFAKAYQCKEGSKMAPKLQCTVW